jgi:hypothetical protein
MQANGSCNRQSVSHEPTPKSYWVSRSSLLVAERMSEELSGGEEHNDDDRLLKMGRTCDLIGGDAPSMILVATFIEAAGLGAELERHAHCAQCLITHNRRPLPPVLPLPHNSPDMTGFPGWRPYIFKQRYLFPSLHQHLGRYVASLCLFNE